MHYTEYFTLRDCSGFLQIRSHIRNIHTYVCTYINKNNPINQWSVVTCKSNTCTNECKEDNTYMAKYTCIENLLLLYTYVTIQIDTYAWVHTKLCTIT